jgi:hypothetical protein
MQQRCISNGHAIDTYLLHCYIQIIQCMVCFPP